MPVTANLSQIHYQQFGFGHLLDRVTQALTAQSGVLDTAIWHVVNAKRRHVACNQRADLQFIVSVKKQFGVTSKDTRLQSIRRAVDLAQDLMEIEV